MAEVKTVEQVRIKVAEKLQKRWLDLKSIKGWLKGYKGIPQEAQEEIAQQIQALFAEYGLRPDLNHIVILGDRPYVTREGLLYYARKTGELKRIKVELLERGRGYCIVKAKVFTKDGGEFEALGDASESNTNRMVSPHLIRMAETRAINRALREAFPIGLCSYEELSETDVTEREEGGAPAKPVKVEGSSQTKNNKTNGSEKMISQNQLGFVWKLAKEAWDGVSQEEIDAALHELVEREFGKQSLKELTSKEASRLIDILKELKNNSGEDNFQFD